MIAHHRDLLIGGLYRSHGYRRAKQRSGATVRKYLIALSCMYRVGMRELRVCDTNPVTMVSKPPESEWRKRFLTGDEREALLETRKRSRSKDLYLAVLISLTTGIRQGELKGLHWRDIDLKRARGDPAQD